jgi:hypothetical protein
MIGGRRGWGVVASVALAACYPNPDQLRQKAAGPLPGTGGEGGSGMSGGAAADAAKGPVDAAPPDAAVDGNGAGSAARRCPEYAVRFCARYRECSPTQAALAFGGDEQCRQRVQLECDLLALPGVTWPTQACADALPTHPCDDLLRNSDPAACRSPGALEENAQCASSFQCQTRRCTQLAGARCFTCLPRASLGGACGSNAGCQDDLVCGDKKVCVAPRALGAVCDADNPCLVPLLCRQGICAKRGGEGTSCSATDDSCDIVAGYGCNRALGKCVRYTVTGTCRTNPDGTFESCAARGTCDGSSSTCVPAAADDAACSDALGPHCLSPATCKNGLCKLPTPTACP